LQAQVDDAVAKGAKVLCGGSRAGMPSDRFYPPTVLVDVTHEMAIMVDESFGPVVGIMKVGGAWWAS
jgi:acyl-CoA reductase-like NAD-dependent aldehyde dehydrogenase